MATPRWRSRKRQLARGDNLSTFAVYIADSNSIFPRFKERPRSACLCDPCEHKVSVCFAFSIAVVFHDVSGVRRDLCPH